MGFLADALSGVGNVLSMPGDYTRGLLSGKLGERVTGEQLLNNYGIDGGGLGGFAASVLTDPLTYAGLGAGAGALGKVLGGGAKAAEGLAVGGEAADAASMFSRLKPLRKEFTMVKDIGTNAAGNPIGHAVGNFFHSSTDKAARMARIREVSDATSKMSAEAARAGQYGEATTQAMFHPDSMTGMIYRTARDPIANVRHESVHGMIEAARRAGTTGNLPLNMRIPSQLSQAESPIARGLGLLGEETVANSVEGRGFADQLARGMEFLNNPKPVYAADLNEVSPLVSQIYQNRVIPLAPKYLAALGGGLGAGVGGATLASYLGGQ